MDQCSNELVKGITTLDELLEYVGTRQYAGGTVMSNFEHTVEEGAEEGLRTTGMWAGHTAWEFYGHVWYEESDRLFHEVACRYHVPVGHYAAETLRDLMQVVNDAHGWG